MLAECSRDARASTQVLAGCSRKHAECSRDARGMLAQAHRCSRGARSMLAGACSMLAGARDCAQGPSWFFLMSVINISKKITYIKISDIRRQRSSQLNIHCSKDEVPSFWKIKIKFVLLLGKK